MSGEFGPTGYETPDTTLQLFGANMAAATTPGQEPPSVFKPITAGIGGAFSWIGRQLESIWGMGVSAFGYVSRGFRSETAEAPLTGPDRVVRQEPLPPLTGAPASSQQAAPLQMQQRATQPGQYRV